MTNSQALRRTDRHRPRRPGSGRTRQIRAGAGGGLLHRRSLSLWAVLLLVSGCASGPRLRQPAEQIVVLGASIAAGYRSDISWPALLQEQITQSAASFTVVNASVSGTHFLTTVGALSSNLLREGRDELSVPDVRTVILTDLINDMQAPPHIDDPAVYIAGLRQFVEQAHQRGIRVIVTTMSPYGGYDYSATNRYQRAGEACRQQVNTFIRTSKLFDDTIDLDLALRDPRIPTRLLPAYDSGDHLHPSTAGHQKMAAAIHVDDLVTESTNP